MVVESLTRPYRVAVALCIMGLMILGLCGSWLAYLWSGQTQFDFGP